MTDPATKLAALDAKTTTGAGAIIDIMSGGKLDWRSRLEDSDFLESADWQTALEYARAAQTALVPRADMAELDAANRDCLAKRKPGEPVFIILGRDPDGGNIVRLWGERRRDAGEPGHGEKAIAIAERMVEWAQDHKPTSAPPPEAYPTLTREAERAATVAWLEGVADRLWSSAQGAKANAVFHAKEDIEQGSHIALRESSDGGGAC